MSEKPEAVRGWGHQLAEGGLCDRCFAPADKRELIQHGKAVPVAIVPMPENGEVREMWVLDFSPDYPPTLYTTEEVNLLCSSPLFSRDRDDFRPVTVIDREVRE